MKKKRTKKRTKKKIKLGGSSNTNIELNNFTKEKVRKNNDGYYLVESVYFTPGWASMVEYTNDKPTLIREIYYSFDNTLKIIDYNSATINYYIWTKGEWLLFNNDKVDEAVGVFYNSPSILIEEAVKDKDSELGKYLRTRSTGNSKKIVNHILEQIESNIPPLRPGNTVLSMLNNVSKGRLRRTSRTTRNKFKN